MSTSLIAIDPGAISGALAVFVSDGRPYVGDIPVVNGQIDGAALFRIVRDMRPDMAVVENVHSMPKQGVASTFKFGVACGIIDGVLASCGVPVCKVVPSEWKKAFRLTGKPKDAARARAIALFPDVTGLERKKDVGRADALLLGYFWIQGSNRLYHDLGAIYDSPTGAA